MAKAISANQIGMLKNYLKIAVRNIKNQKVFSFINIFGLTTSLAAFLLIALYIFDELTYDRFHKNADSIYRVIETKTSASAKESNVASVAADVATRLKKDFPEVENATRFSMFGRVNVTNAENTSVFYEPYYIADSSFTNVFGFPLVDGLAKTALNEPYTVIITSETAKKIFGSEKVVGKTIMTEGDSTPYKITAVVNIPDNSHLQFDLLFSEASLYSSKEMMDFINNDWTSNSFVTYVLLRNKESAPTAAGITRIVNSTRKNDGTAHSRFQLQPLKDIHFYSANIEGSTDAGGNIMYIYVFGVVAIFVLLIACINYMNLTTARFAKRSKEIAVRKVAGALRKNLAGQFITEAFLLTLIALLLAIAVTESVLPWFNTFTGKNLSLNFNSDYRVWLTVILITTFVGLLSGIYPAFFQSKMKPYLLLKSNINPGRGTLSLRKALVVFQFSLSIIMIIATVVIYQQTKYVNTANMGFDKEQLLVVDINSGLVRRSAEAIQTEFEKIPSVKSVSLTSRVPGEWKVIPKVKVKAPGGATTQGEDVYYIAVDKEFIKTFGVTLLSGRNFSGAADSATVLLNEAAAKLLGITQPSQQLIEIPSVAFSGNATAFDRPFRARVTGIVKDFNFQSMRTRIGPMVLAYQNNPVHNIDYFTAKVSPGNIEATLKSMQQVLAKIDASHLFEYHFLDKQWALFYRDDKIRETIFFVIALLAIFIAALGLLGLTIYAAEQRLKEIGIRKILGASISGIVLMLSKDFLKLVFIASVIAFPVAWFAMNTWLQDFAYRIHISWWVFILSACAAVVIALATISYQAIKAAVANPVKSLRTE